MNDDDDDDDVHVLHVLEDDASTTTGSSTCSINTTGTTAYKVAHDIIIDRSSLYCCTVL